MPKRKSINEEVLNFQTQEKDVQIVAPFKSNKKRAYKKVASKKKVVKVEEGEMDGNEEIRKKLKNYGSFNCTFHGEMESK